MKSGDGTQAPTGYREATGMRKERDIHSNDYINKDTESDFKKDS